MGASESDLDQLIAGIYSAVLDPSRWGACLDQISARLDAGSGIQVLANTCGLPAVVVSSNIEPDAGHRYLTRFRTVDPYMKGISQVKAPGIVAGSSVVPYSDLMKGEYYNDFLKPQNLHWQLSLIFELDGLQSSYLTFQRARAKGDFSEEDAQFLARLMPHLRTAVQVQRQLLVNQRHSQMLESALDDLERGVLIIGRDGKVIYMNRTAQTLVQRGAAVSIKGGRLRATDQSADRELRALIAACHADEQYAERRGGGIISLPAAEQCDGLRAQVAPLCGEVVLASGAASHPVVTVILASVFRPPANRSEALQRIYAFTPAESTCAVLLAEGSSIDEVAETLGLSRNTIRAHMRSLYSKTNTHRQGALVAALHRELAKSGSVFMP